MTFTVNLPSSNVLVCFKSKHTLRKDPIEYNVHFQRSSSSSSTSSPPSVNWPHLHFTFRNTTLNIEQTNQPKK